MHSTVLPIAFFSGTDIGLLFGLSGLAVGVLFGLFGMYFHHRRRVLWHETARLALEKGQPLPALPNDAPQRDQPKDDAANDFRGGLVLIGTGLGLYLFLGTLQGQGLGYVGAIPGFIGVALLVSGSVRLLYARKNSKTADRPPQS